MHATPARTMTSTDMNPACRDAFVQFVLALADDKLMMGTRNSDWTGLAPILEEDIAFSSLAQDEMAHASALYAFIAPYVGRTADQLAFGRGLEDYRCAPIVTPADEFNWATALTRHFLCSHYETLVLERCAQSNLKDFSALTKRQYAEQLVHVRHADDWVHRLGTGAGDAPARMQAALDDLAPLARGLFEPVENQILLVNAGIWPGDDAAMFDQWTRDINRVLGPAGLSMTVDRWDPNERGGRRGVHSDALRELLDEMCEVYRQDPDAEW